MSKDTASIHMFRLYRGHLNHQITHVFCNEKPQPQRELTSPATVCFKNVDAEIYGNLGAVRHIVHLAIYVIHRIWVCFRMIIF